MSIVINIIIVIVALWLYMKVFKSYHKKGLGGGFWGYLSHQLGGGILLGVFLISLGILFIQILVALFS